MRMGQLVASLLLRASILFQEQREHSLEGLRRPEIEDPAYVRGRVVHHCVLPRIFTLRYSSTSMSSVLHIPAISFTLYDLFL